MPYARKDLQNWQALWRMSNEEISCTQCAARQASKLSNTDFVHAPVCPRAGTGQRPWEELMFILIVPTAQALSA